MSGWGTFWFVDADDHDSGCAVWEPLPKTSRAWQRLESDGSRWRLGCGPCTCEAGPIAYRGSHVLPADADERAGSVEVASVNTLIRRDGGDLPAEAETDAVHPWLRLSVNDATVILDRAQVSALREALAEWDDHVEAIE